MRPVLTLFATLLLSLAKEVAAQPEYLKPGTPGKPRSMEGVENTAIQIYLKRSDLEEGGKEGARGHFYAPLHISNGGQWKDYKMQISAYNPVTGIVSSSCTLHCDVDVKFEQSTTRPLSTDKFQHEFKNFDAATVGKANAGGFKTSMFMGQYSA